MLLQNFNIDWVNSYLYSTVNYCCFLMDVMMNSDN